MKIIDSHRNEYGQIEHDSIKIYDNPFIHFENWMDDALRSKEKEPTAMALSTIGIDGFPQSRIVLLKYFDEDGFIFFTNYNSDKGVAINNNSAVSLLFFWSLLERQIRITGTSIKTDEQLSDRYFSTRPLASCIGAWASEQSKEIPSKEYLEKRIEKFEHQFKDQFPPRPSFWGGFKVIPEKMEFWQGGRSRLHDRILYKKVSDRWQINRLAP